MSLVVLKKELSNGYRLEAISKSDYDEFRKINEPLIFPNRFDINVHNALSAEERASITTLNTQLGTPYELRLGFFFEDQMVGWSYGVQLNGETFRMVTTGITPAHQRKGVYSSFLTWLAEHVQDKGFQILFSRHYATDNQVIIPKLRFGFLISGFELTDDFGLLLRLSYYFNEVRRKTLHVRSGFQQADDEIKQLIRQY